MTLRDRAIGSVMNFSFRLGAIGWPRFPGPSRSWSNLSIILQSIIYWNLDKISWTILLNSSSLMPFWVAVAFNIGWIKIKLLSNRIRLWFYIVKMKNIISNKLHTKSLYAYDSKWKFLMQSTILFLISVMSASDFILSENISIKPDKPKLWPFIWKLVSLLLENIKNLRWYQCLCRFQY